MTLSLKDELNRYGMTKYQALRTRDLAMQALSPAAVATARAAWSDMAALVRQSAHHPETIRLRFLSLLAEGVPVADAEAETRAFALSPKN